MPCRCGQRIGLEGGITSCLCSCFWACMRTDLANPKIAFPFSPSCTFSSFSYITYTHIPFVLLPILVSLPLRKFFPSFFFFFNTLFCHHLSSSVPTVIQSTQSFPKVPQKILPILLHCPMFPSGSALPLSQKVGETPSFPHPLILPVLPAIVLWGRLQQATKGETCKGRILLVLLWVTFPLSGDKHLNQICLQAPGKEDSK